MAQHTWNRPNSTVIQVVIQVVVQAPIGIRPSEEYHGIERPKHRSLPAPSDAAGWASRAFRASLDSEKALQEAPVADRSTGGGSRGPWAPTKEDYNGRKPYLTFCDQVAARVRANPMAADGSAMVELRRFCAGCDFSLENFLDTATRRPEALATRAGLRLYDVPPLEYPEADGARAVGRGDRSWTWALRLVVALSWLTVDKI
eukprot:Skav219572  [mRNA]  locus=scaffold3203:48933:53025:+ [translate_table: standard]